MRRVSLLGGGEEGSAEQPHGECVCERERYRDAERQTQRERHTHRGVERQRD